MQLLNTLYVTLPESYLHLDNDTLRVEIERETRLRVPCIIFPPWSALAM
jgi:CRISPR-associated protein Cas1